MFDSSGNRLRTIVLPSMLVALLWPLDGCGGKAVEHQTLNQGVGEPSFTSNAGGGGNANGGLGGQASAGESTAGTTSGASSAGEAGNPGGAAGSTNEGGAAGTGDAGGTGGSGGLAGGAGGKTCASVTECPRPANACIAARCSAGACVTDNVPAGELYVLDAPADCHATTACDGAGHATLVIDQSNTPTPPNPCLAGTCNNQGVAGSEPVPLGTRCNWDFGRGRCDGAGQCVTCITSADCPLGQSCDAHHSCVGQPCSEAHCGGGCPACLGDSCASNHDCASHSCDPQTLNCVLDPQCADQQQNGNETAVDCGGGTCPLCAPGKACLLDTDCSSFACDTLTLRCVGDTCADHHRDSDESDVDCGGSNATCRRCTSQEGCYSNFDCLGGHFCNGGKECQ